MESTINSTSINMNMYIKPIQPANLPIKDISDFPSKQAEEVQKHLLELDKQNKLKEEFMNRYGNNLGKPNSLANYILADFENRKRLFIEWTGIETFDDKHTIKKIGIKLNEITYGSRRYFLWKCNKCSHEWVVRTPDRIDKNSNCPACGGTSLIKGKNDLETYCKEHPEFTYLIDEFMGLDEQFNILKPSDVSKSGKKVVWWKCRDCGYAWTATLNNRTSTNEQGCPKCGRLRTIEALHLKGEPLDKWCDRQGAFGERLKSEFIGLDKDNQPIKISDVSMSSHGAIQWKCGKCHRIWLATPNARTLQQTGCPYCTPKGTSFPEQYIYHSLLQLFPNTKNRQKDIIKHYEYDIIIPELNLCIEYSGYGWHKDKLERDKLKEEHCRENGAHFLQIYGHRGDMIEQDTYTKEKIIYQALNNKSQHIIQLQHIVKFILQEYSPEHSLEEIDFELVEQQASEVMNKA